MGGARWQGEEGEEGERGSADEAGDRREAGEKRRRGGENAGVPEAGPASVRESSASPPSPLYIFFLLFP